MATNRQGYSIKLNGRVQVPKYYWKAICDPFEKLSVIFWGENTIGDAQGNEGQVESCCGKLQKKLYGVICCSSLNEAKRDYKGIFQIPEFHIKNCVPSLLGNKLKDFIVNRLQ